MDSSPIAPSLCYTVSTKQSSVREPDAAEISADNPTAYLCDAGSEGRGIELCSGSFQGRCVFLEQRPGFIKPFCPDQEIYLISEVDFSMRLCYTK